MPNWRRLTPIALLGSLSVAYVLARPGLHLPYLTILEYPIGALILGGLLWRALRDPRRPPITVWQRHEQLVRPLSDPALAPDLDALNAWVATGAAPDAAADVLARAASSDPDVQAEVHASLLSQMQVTASRRTRESFLKEQTQLGA